MSPAVDPFTFPTRAVRKAMRLAKKAVSALPLFRSATVPKPIVLAPYMRAFGRGSPVVDSLPDLIYVEMAMEIWRSDIEIERARQVGGDFLSVSCVACPAWKTRPRPDAMVGV